MTNTLPTRPIVITACVVHDIRFPTSLHLDGSDAMNRDPDYSAAYVILETDADSAGHGLTFTIGRGNELCVAAAQTLGERLVGRTLQSIAADLGAFWYEMVADSQLRWVGPERGSSTSRWQPWSTPSGISTLKRCTNRSGRYWST